MTDIKELREAGVIPSERQYAPHMAQRLMKTNSIVEEVYKSKERREELFKEAFAIFNAEAKHYGDSELNIKSAEDQEKFALVFIRRMAENIAVLLNTGYMHTGIHSANVTLAAEIVDIGTASHLSENKRIKSGFEVNYGGLRLGQIKDIRDSAYSIKRMMMAMLDAGMSRPRKEECLEAMLAAFNGKANAEAMRLQGTDIDDAGKWFYDIARAVLVDNKRLHSLINYTIDEWPNLEE